MQIELASINVLNQQLLFVKKLTFPITFERHMILPVPLNFEVIFTINLMSLQTICGM